MSNKNNKKSAKKRMDPAKKAKIFTGLKTLYSNEAVVAAGRTLPWFLPIIVVLAAIALALIPTLVTGLNSDMGASSIGNNSYGYENGLVAFGDFLEENKSTLNMRIEDNTLKVDGWETALNNRDVGSQWFTFPITEAIPDPSASSSEESSSESPEESSESTTSASSGSSSTVITPTEYNGFEVFYYVGTEILSFDEFRGRILLNMNPYTNRERLDNPDRTYDTTYRTNLLLLSDKQFYFAKFPRGGTGTGAHFYGKFDHPAMQGKNLLDLYKVSVDATAGSAKRTDEIRANWQEFFKQSYESTKNTSVWSMVGIMAGVDLGVILLFGGVLFLMTRGKTNPFRTVKWYEAMMMAGWASFTPAVISIPIGFFLSQYAAFVFLFLYGLRVMWMSMRALRPYEVAGK